MERNVETSNSYRKLNDLEDEERFTVSDENDTDEPFGRTGNILLNGNKKSNLKLKSKPNTITQSNPGNNHFTNNYKRVTQPSNNPGNKPSKPLVLVVGDRTLKHITSYEIKKSCKGDNVMIRSISGGKIKNIRNLIIDALEDVTPDTIIIHVSTNDISSGKVLIP